MNKPSLVGLWVLPFFLGACGAGFGLKTDTVTEEAEPDPDDDGHRDGDVDPDDDDDPDDDVVPRDDEGDCPPTDETPETVAVEAACELETRPLALTIEWEDEGVGSSLATPVVGNLTDDNGDGRVDEYDIPDIVVKNRNAELVAVSGDGSGEHWRFAGGGGTLTPAAPALGDLDGDGDPEVVGSDIVYSPVSGEAEYFLIALSGSTGELIWRTSLAETGLRPLHSTVGIYDLDSDGRAEVVFGSAIFDGVTGELIGMGEHGTGSPTVFTSVSLYRAYFSSLAADIDGDGVMEIVVGDALYDSDGETIWYNGETDGFPAVADFNGDGLGEIVVSGLAGRVRLQDADGNVWWETQVVDEAGCSTSSGLGRPTVADYDGDGEPEIAVLGPGVFSVLDTDGSILWQTKIDDTSGMGASTAFDFHADGSFEAIIADQSALTIFDGSTGDQLATMGEHSSTTGSEGPIVADVDGDGHAEIVMVSMAFPDYGDEQGLKVIGSAFDDWFGARGVWNQAEYAITTVDDDLGIPTIPVSNWPLYNSFRAAPPIELNPDAVAVFKEACTLECDEGRLRLVALVGNVGTTALPAGVPLTVYAEQDGEWVALQTQTTPEAIESGQTSDGLVFELDPDDIPMGAIELVVDDEDLASNFAECRLDNNVLLIDEGLCP